MAKLETTQYVKATNRGKISIALQGNIKAFFQAMIEKIMAELEHSMAMQLDMASVETKKNFAILSELYIKYFAAFSSKQPCKIQLTMSQALCLWQMSNEYETDFYSDAQMGALLMQLHQKLS